MFEKKTIPIKFKVLISDPRYYHSENCEWVFDKNENKLLLYFKPYKSIEGYPRSYFILFKNVVFINLENKYSVDLYDSIRNSTENQGVLYEIEEVENSGQNKAEENQKRFFTFQPYNGSLEIIASSYEIIRKDVT